MSEVNNTFCVKQNIKGVWSEGGIDDLEKFLSDRGSPLSKEEKERLPAFGFAKKLGTTSNQQLYPTNFLILELDTPKQIKEKIKRGDKDLEREWIVKFTHWFTLFKELGENLKYYSMYMTPSMRGLRFILKVEQPIENEEQYKKVVITFLKQFKEHGIDERFYDLRFNQVWFFPTFKKFFFKSQKLFFFQEKKEKKTLKKEEKPINTLKNAKKTPCQKKSWQSEEKNICEILSYLT